MFKTLKFEKSKYPIFRISFWILIFCSLITIFMIAKNNLNAFQINSLEKYAKPITINVSFNRPNNDTIFICFDNYCKALENNSILGNKTGLSNIKSAQFNSNDEYFVKNKIKKIYFAYPQSSKNIQNQIDYFDIYIDNENYRINFDEILKNKTQTLPIISGKDMKKMTYIVKNIENINIYSDSFLTKISTIFLSLIFNWNFYLVPYCWLIIAFLIFIFNKDVSKKKIQNKLIVLSSILGLFLLICATLFFISPKEIKNDTFIDFIEKDIKLIPKNTIIHVLSTKEKNNLKNKNIIWHKITTPLNKIEKNNFVKNNKKTIIYFDSDSVNLELETITNARTKVYKTNYSKNAKLEYN